MAVGLTEPPAPDARPADWTEITRSFQIALDPRKLLVAAAGVLAMSVGWWLLSLIFAPTEPDPKAERYQPAVISTELVNKKRADGSDYAEADYAIEGQRRLDSDLARYRAMNALSGPGGSLSVLPWDEYRGPNPFNVATDIAAGNSVTVRQTAGDFASGTLPTLIEPIRKLFLPALKILDADLGFWDRFYLLLCLVWTVVVWAFAGGVITRIAAVQLGGRDRITLPQAVRFVTSRYLNYVASPLVPIGIVGFIILVMAIYGTIAMIPVIGDILLYGLLWPLVLLGGIVMTLLIVGLIGYPLMYPTVSVEGSDTFDAVSRSLNYVYQAPLSFLWYNLVSLLFGGLAVLIVVFMGSLMVYTGKFAVSQAPYSEHLGRSPDFLFVHAPEAFGWKKLLLDGGPLALREIPVEEIRTVPVRVDTPGADTVVPAIVQVRPRVVYGPVNPDVSKQYLDDMRIHNNIGGWMVTFWLVVALLFVIGFSYSYFWTAATVIYLLMRRKVDEVELEEVYVEDPLNVPGSLGNIAPGGVAGTTPTEASSTPPVGGVNLPTVPATPNFSPNLPPVPAAPPVAPPPVQTPPASVVPSPVIAVPPPPEPTVTLPAFTPEDEPNDSEEPTMTLPAVSPPPAAEPPLFPPPTDELKKDDEFKKDDDGV